MIDFYAFGDAYTVAEDPVSPIYYVLEVLQNDVLAAGSTGTLDIASFAQPLHGSVQLDETGALPVLRYTPELNFVGTDTFTYVGSDTLGNTNTAVVAITVTNTNDAPVLTPGCRRLRRTKPRASRCRW